MKGCPMVYEKLFDTAMEKVCKVRFHYKDREGEQTNRTIQPIVMFRYTNIDGKLFTYVIGFCELDSDYRTFRFDRMSQVTLVNETFSVKFVDIKSHLKRKVVGSPGFILRRVKVKKYVKGMPGPPLTPTVEGEDTYGKPGPETIKPPPPPPGDHKYPKMWESPKLFNSPRLCRSPLEEKILTALDNNDKVYGYEIEPFKIPYWAGNKRRFYTPDLLVRYKNGRKVIVEVKSEGDINEPLNQAKFKAIEQYANEKGYGFEVWTDRTMIPAAWGKAAANTEKPKGRTGQGETTPAQQNNWGCFAFIVAAVLFYLLIWYISR
jgi:hypothetical protein